jgi:hypothetical protein
MKKLIMVMALLLTISLSYAKRYKKADSKSYGKQYEKADSNELKDYDCQASVYGKIVPRLKAIKAVNMLAAKEQERDRIRKKGIILKFVRCSRITLLR